jgi:hypothetical protein
MPVRIPCADCAVPVCGLPDIEELPGVEELPDIEELSDIEAEDCGPSDMGGRACGLSITLVAVLGLGCGWTGSGSGTGCGPVPRRDQRCAFPRWSPSCGLTEVMNDRLLAIPP